MNNCNLCGGVIAEPGMIYPEAMNMCRCKFNLQEDVDRQRKLKWLNSMEDGKAFEYKESVKQILSIASNLSLEQLRAVVDLLKQLHDCQSLTSSSVGLKTTKREF